MIFVELMPFISAHEAILGDEASRRLKNFLCAYRHGNHLDGIHREPRRDLASIARAERVARPPHAPGRGVARHAGAQPDRGFTRQRNRVFYRVISNA